MTGTQLCTAQYLVTDPTNNLGRLDLFSFMIASAAGRCVSRKWLMAAPTAELPSPLMCSIAVATSAPPSAACGFRTCSRKLSEVTSCMTNQLSRVIGCPCLPRVRTFLAGAKHIKRDTYRYLATSRAARSVAFCLMIRGAVLFCVPGLVGTTELMSNGDTAEGKRRTSPSLHRLYIPDHLPALHQHPPRRVALSVRGAGHTCILYTMKTLEFDA